MKTKLVEFKNRDGEILRGIITVPGEQIKGGAVFAHGFERNTTVEKKFKMMSGALAKRGVVSLRFDFAGCGLSDGDFSKMTVANRAQELLKAIEIFQKEFNFEKINFVAHSLGACVLAKALGDIKTEINKIVLIAPALNQKELLRFYFARDNNPNIKIFWQNCKQYFNEEKFLKDCAQDGRMLKEHYVDSDYFIEAKDLDFSDNFKSIKDRVLHMHGDADDKVPLKSLNIEFENKIIVKNGDHDLERPYFWDQWFDKAVDFLTNGQI